MKDTSKRRIDLELVEQGIVRSRTHAQKKIDSGAVFLKTDSTLTPILKASELVDRGASLIVREDLQDAYVSRGALKLKGACEKLGLDGFETFHCLDVGASTGGFTDFLLQAGVPCVICVDVGHGQLHPKISQDSRVTHFEKINCRYPEQLKVCLAEKRFDLIVMDVSFISGTLIYPNLLFYLKPSGKLLALVKPQFELGPDALNRSGVVKNPDLYKTVEKKVKENLHNVGFEVLDYFQSSELGGDGNVEFFVYANRAVRS